MVMHIPVRCLNNFAAGNFQDDGSNQAVIMRSRTIWMSLKEFLGIKREQDMVVVDKVQRDVRVIG
jgi:hypothetical protein